MIPLRMVIRQILHEDIGQRPLAQHQPLGEGLRLDGAHESLTVGVQIQTAGRQEERFHTTTLEQRIKRLREFRVPVVSR